MAPGEEEEAALAAIWARLSSKFCKTRTGKLAGSHRVQMLVLLWSTTWPRLIRASGFASSREAVLLTLLQSAPWLFETHSTAALQQALPGSYQSLCVRHTKAT